MTKVKLQKKFNFLSSEEIDEKLKKCYNAEKRDKQDMTRDIAPLKKVDDAMVIDSTTLSIEDVTNLIVDEYQNRKKKNV